MELYNTIKASEGLRFLDSSNGSIYTIDNILPDLNNVPGDRLLAFVYINNQIDAIGLYLALLDSNHSIALLKDDLAESLKISLETRYEPDVIFDPTRVGVRGYYQQVIKAESWEANIFLRSIQGKTPIHPNIKLMLSTSGTTGSPKFVKLSAINLSANARSIAKYLPILPEDVTPLNLPLSYSYGLSVLHSNAIKGATIVCNLPDIISKEFWKAMQSYKFTSLAGVPFVYEVLLKIGFLKNRYPSLRYLTQAGGNLNKKAKQIILDYCNKNSVDFYVMYGQTEATARISFVPPVMLAENITSIGIPIDQGELRIDSENNELVYSGPNIFGGYAQNISDLEFWDQVEELRTGDLGTQDSNGLFYVTGRLKRMVKLFGNRINLDEIESDLKIAFPKTSIGCFGVEDKQLVVCFSDSRLSGSMIKKKLQNLYKINPNVVRPLYVDVFPLTANGKVNYSELAKFFSETVN